MIFTAARRAALAAVIFAFTSCVTAAAPQIIHKISTDKSIAQVLLAVESTVPTTGIPYEYSAVETEALKKLFAKPQPHSALTSNKYAASERLVDVISKRTSAIMRMVFNDKNGKHVLHLAFKFGYENIGRTLVPATTITVISIKALEPWQREWLSSAIKVDSYFVRNLLIAAGALTGAGIGHLLGKPAQLRAQRRNLPWMDKIQETTKAATARQLEFTGEFYHATVKTLPGQPFASSFQRIYDSSWPVFDTSDINIPEEATVGIIYIPGPGAISALAASGKLGGNAKKNQIRIFVFPAAYAWQISSEFSKHSVELESNNWVSCGVSECTNEQSAQLASQSILAKCSEDKTNTLLRNSLQNWDAKHLQCALTIGQQNPHAIVCNHAKNSGWTFITNPAGANAEIVILPLSTLGIKPETSIDPGSRQEVPTGKVSFIHSPLPETTEQIKHRALLIINDLTAPYDLTTMLIPRMAYPQLISALDAAKKLRFDVVFMNIEPTASHPLSYVHYVTPRPTAQGDATADGSESAMKIFWTTADSTPTAIEAVYQAASHYLESLKEQQEKDLLQAEMDAQETARKNFEHSRRAQEIEEQERAVISSIAWSERKEDTPLTFQQFIADVLAVQGALDALDLQRTIHDTQAEFIALQTKTSASGLDVREEQKLKELSKIHAGGFKRLRFREVTRHLYHQDGGRSLAQILNEVLGATKEEKADENYHLIFANRADDNVIFDTNFTRALSQGTTRSQLQQRLLREGRQVIIWGNQNFKKTDGEYRIVPLIDHKTSRLCINIGERNGRIYLSINHCSSLSDDPQYTSHENYQEAIIIIAKAIIENRKFAEENFKVAALERQRAEERLARERAIDAEEEVSRQTDPKRRRALPPSTPESATSTTDKRSPAEIIAADVLEISWETNMDATQAEASKELKVFGLNVKTLKSYFRGANRYSVVGKKYVLFTQSTDDINTNFFDKIDDDEKKKLFFVIAGYEGATKLGHEVSVTQSSGTSRMTLQALKAMLEARAAV